MASTLQLGPFRLEAEAGVLTRDGVATPLGARGVAVLVALARRAGEYVQKSDILDAAWPGLVVEDSNLAVQISSIRRVLAQVAGGDAWIETLPRRGYRYVGPVSAARDPAPGGQAVRPPRRTNLPEPLTSFVGREAELVDARRLLPRARLLTIVGAGGIGKTRFALELAAELLDAYRDGVWFADLSPLVDPALVPNVVAQVLGVRESSGKPSLESLCAHARTRQTLVVLDNCEHVLDAAAALVAAMLRSAPELTFVATSREPLRVDGEQMLTLAPLSLPAADASAEAIRRAEAVQLFVERAQRTQPAFDLARAGERAVAEVCVRLDGMPLALELAAARVNALSVAEINARLDDRFRLLTTGPRSAPARQQTLRAALDWSHGLLDDGERVALRRLAVFPGEFTLEAAEAVIADASLAAAAAASLVVRLVARSLVVAAAGEGGTRYRLLDTTRAYARSKLDDAGETDAVSRSHAAYVRRLFAQAFDDWLRGDDDAWDRRYRAERDNLRAALDWASGTRGDPSLALELAGSSGPIWLEMSLHGEGRRRIEAALAQVSAQTPALVQARLWLWLGMVVGDAAPLVSAEAKAKAVDLYRTMNDATGLGFALVQYAYALSATGRAEEAVAHLDEASPLLGDPATPKALARCEEVRAFTEMQRGNLAAARAPVERAFGGYQRSGAHREALRTLGNVAYTTWALGDVDAALRHFRELLARLRRAPNTTSNMLGFALTNLAGVLVEQGALDDAMVAAREGMPLLMSVGCGWINADHLAARLAQLGRLDAAARIAGYADARYAANRSARQPGEARARARVEAALTAEPGLDRPRLAAEGAALSDEEACRMMLEG